MSVYKYKSRGDPFLSYHETFFAIGRFSSPVASTNGRGGKKEFGRGGETVVCRTSLGAPRISTWKRRRRRRRRRNKVEAPVLAGRSLLSLL
jgi:hypothetical protein